MDTTGLKQRRSFLQGIAVLGLAGLGSRYLPASPSNPCAAATSAATLVGPGEPGEPLIVSGQVFRPDGVTPAEGVTLYVYQTDATGYYAPRGVRAPRIRGWMKIGAEGRYQYRTIRPAAYPERRFAAHIHTQLWGGGYPPQWNTDLLFADDPLISARERAESESLGRFGFIQAPVRGADGILRCTHDLRLKSRGDRFEDNILHGLEACGVSV
jgi:protocatechuate 3,4-dioxygenase beta subunit